MAEMVEKVTEAIAPYMDYSSRYVGTEQCARAAIEAMREPTIEQVEIFYRTLERERFNPNDFTPAFTKAWNAVLDAALQEGD